MSDKSVRTEEGKTVFGRSVLRLLAFMLWAAMHSCRPVLLQCACVYHLAPSKSAEEPETFQPPTSSWHATRANSRMRNFARIKTNADFPLFSHSLRQFNFRYRLFNDAFRIETGSATRLFLQC
jgi:hypothetical protein